MTLCVSGRNWIETTIGLPDERPQDWATERFEFGGRTILLARLRNPDELLDDPAVLRASNETDYMPYWAYLWPGATLLAERILASSWQQGARAIEIGCGLGLAGVAALAAGLHVTFSDYSPAALAVAAHNARLNGFKDFELKSVDWQDPPREQYDVVLGADVLYEPRCLPEVLRVLDCVLAPDGEALLSDPGRAVADGFESLARLRGYSVECESALGRTDQGQPIQGRIFRVQPHRRAS